MPRPLSTDRGSVLGGIGSSRSGPQRLHERSAGRSNGHRTLSTTAGDPELRIPKLRTGSFFRRCSSAAAGWTAPVATTALPATPPTTDTAAPSELMTA